ncbi:27706_t:CDS:2 [Dentiscutata erythropus]|uniref:27706_t:CDS:1 n=1 Tax=Dentiscutata erythropus TaxID=1348616 RepID=A0A9N8WMT7_9GLOM|nr:27706_t:CDS:2 [Dentiscutata erythropus]
MPGNPVWCTCQVCSLKEGGGSLNNILSSNTNIFSPYIFDQETNELNLNWRKTYRELKNDSNNLEISLESNNNFESCFVNDNEFADRLENTTEFTYRLESNNEIVNRIESDNEFADILEKSIARLDDELENDYNIFKNGIESSIELENELESSIELENELESSIELENELESSSELENELESSSELENELESSSELEIELESDDNSSFSTSTTSTSSISTTSLDNEEVAIIIRLLKVKIQSNLTDEAFCEIINATVIKPMSLYLKGVKCSSINCKDKFILRGCVLSWSGDMPALTKLIGLTGHNSYSGCCYCNIIGIYSSHVYYPIKPPKDKKGWGLFVKAVRLCQKQIITNNDLNKIKSCLLAFYTHYEKEYYRGISERLSAMKMCIHAILHVSESIIQTGPCCMTWQYPIERVGGMLLPLTKSKLHPYKNLINNIHLLEIFNCLKFNQMIYNQIFPKIPPKVHEEHLAYTGEYGQDFYFPSAQYKLTQSELIKIKHHFSTIYDVSGLQLMSFSQTGTKYGRLRTKDEVDIYANYPKRPSVFKLQNFYALVEYYLTYEFEGSKVMLAYIQWTSSVEEDSIGIKKFSRMGSYAFINASAIDNCVGFIEIDKLFYIVDKEVDSDE